MKIEILGSSSNLFCNALEALRECGLDGTVVKVQDNEKIRKYPVVSTPALVVNGEVKSSGKIVSQEEIKELLASNAMPYQAETASSSDC